MTSRSLGHRAPLLWLAAPMMVGLALAKGFDIDRPATALVLAAIAIAAGAIALRADTRWLEAALAGTMLFAGIASYGLQRPRPTELEGLPAREAELTLQVDRVFAAKDPRRAAGLARVLRAAQPVEEATGRRVYFSLALGRETPLPLRSAVIRAFGVLAAVPRDPPADSFDGYLANAGVNFRLGRGKIISEEKPPAAYYRFCAAAEGRLSAILGRGVAEKRPTLVGIYRAMMLGQQHELTEDQIELFRESGTMHVFSISGLHIAAIAIGLHALLGLLRIPRRIEFPLGLAALWLYVDITGAAPSAIRAFIMVALVELSLLLRAPRNPLSALTASAFIILLAAPLQLFSASFQMSYGIVAALLLLGLPLADAAQQKLSLFRDLPKVTWSWHHHARDYVWRGFLAAAAIGLAASPISAVTGISFFKLFTPGSFVVNLWLIPTSTFVIFCGFISLICGLVHFTAASVLANHAAILVLWLVEAGVRHTTGLPGMWFAAGFRAAWLGPLCLVILLLAMGLGYAKGWKGWLRGFWLPFALVAAMLLFGVTYGTAPATPAPKTHGRESKLGPPRSTH